MVDFKQHAKMSDDLSRGVIDFIQGSIIKYVTRYKRCNGLEDLRTAESLLKKLIEDVENSQYPNDGDHSGKCPHCFNYPLLLGADGIPEGHQPGCPRLP